MFWKHFRVFDGGGERGMTLMEVVVATAIFSVSIASLLIVRDRAITNTARAKNIRIARRLTMQLLEEIHAGKEVNAQDNDAFDEENYPGFYWNIKEAETIEVEDPEEKEEKKKGGGAKPKSPPAPLGGGLAALMGAGGTGDELIRYLIEIVYPARTDEGIERLEIITYRLKEPDAGALAKVLGGGLGGALGGGDKGGGGGR